MGLKRTDLISQAGISSNVLAKLGRDEFVAMENISKICKALNCDVGDIMEMIDEENVNDNEKETQIKKYIQLLIKLIRIFVRSMILMGKKE